MSLLLESEAQFASRANEIGLSDEVVRALKVAGVGNLSQLAFPIGQPGQPIHAVEVDTLLQNALGRPGPCRSYFGQAIGLRSPDAAGGEPQADG